MSQGFLKAARTCRRCALYTRKSTEEGLDQEFNSLDAQREAGESYVASQKAEGWQSSATRYDDGGFTGGTLDRPALRRLLDDVAAGEIDCVVVYKVDRLSRSLLDFARIMEVFERHQVSFVSVTQQFNTSTSIGRLIFNVLLSFAQFERELISERTRDKLAAARRKGKRLGGTPVLGYDVDLQSRRLVVNSAEAERVRAIFELYLGLRGLTPVVRELSRRGWVAKRSTTRKGTARGGRPFNKAALHYLLTNVTYRGSVKYEGRLFDGEHEAIVAQEVFDLVQTLLSRNRCVRHLSATSDRPPGLLEGLLHCGPCAARMTHTYTTKGPCRYRYYDCSAVRKRGRGACRSKSIPAESLEDFVWNELAGDQRLDGIIGQAEGLSTQDKAQRLQSVVQRIDYDGRNGDLSIQLISPEDDAS